MGNATGTMEQSEAILAIECDEPDGKIVRYVRPCVLTMDKLETIYNQIKQFKTLFNEDMDSLEKFASCFMFQTADGELHPAGLLWEVDDVGILRLSEIKPGYEAKAHFVFWDKRFKGRQQLILNMMRWVFKRYALHRIVVEVPLYAKRTMIAVEAIGFKKEGRKREAVRHYDSWFDMNTYAMLEEEVWDRISKT